MSSSVGFVEFMRVLNEIKLEFPDFEIIEKKDSILMKVLDVLLKIITLGEMNEFMTAFLTQMGNKLFVPPGWSKRDPRSKAISLRHERVHMRQQVRYGKLLFTLRYLCWPLPAVFALGRRDIEQEAYAETMKAIAEYFGISKIEERYYREYTIDYFMTAQYFWTYPFRKKLEAWYDKTVADIRSELSVN